MTLYRTLILTGLLGGTLVPLSAQLSDPIPETIEKGDLTMKIENWLQAPATSGGSVRARLSMMKPAYDGSGRTFINDLRGQFYIVANDTIAEYVDLNDIFPDFIDENRLGTGFHSFAFHPDFETNGKFYTAHTESGTAGSADFTSPIAQSINVQSVVVEWTATDPAANTFAGTQREVMRMEYNDQVHNIQEIAFNHFVGPAHEDHGMLYICSGDGASVDNGYPEIGHRLDTIYGTLLRIDPLGNNSRNGRYGVPATNPFVDDGDATTLGEIYAWGFRNPHRIIWDSANADRLFLFDIGEKGAEEVNLVVKGGDHGYSVREGTFLLDTAVNHDVVFPLPANDADFDYVYPVAQYDHDEGRAIAGGQIYRGSVFPELQGKMIFGDIANGRIFYLDVDSLALGTQAAIQEMRLSYNGAERNLLQIMGDNRADLRFGIDEAGEIYVTTKRDGRIRRFVAPETNGSGEMSNISTRAVVGTEDDVMIAGFTVIGSARRVLIRGIGPTLSDLGVAGALTNPTMTIRKSGDASFEVTNDDWGDGGNAATIAATANLVGAFALTDGSADSVLMLLLEPGGYTVEIKGVDGATGIALAEVYRIP